jgi:hypothetical protein
MTEKLDLTEYWNQQALTQLARIDAGWVTGDELAWSVFKAAEVIRGRTRAILRQLGDDGLLERLNVRHLGSVMDCYLHDPTVARGLLN